MDGILEIPLAVRSTLAQAGDMLLLLVLVAAVADPGILLGTAIALLVWRIVRAPTWARWGVAAAPVALLLVPASHMDIQPLWTIRLLVQTGPPTGPGLLGSVLTEAWAGPFLLEVVRLGVRLHRLSLPARLAAQERERTAATRALAVTTPTRPSPHPPGTLRLGVEVVRARPFDLSLGTEGRRNEICAGINVVGVPDAGKTTTVLRLADGALAAGWSVVTLDCKGYLLADRTAGLARAHGVAFSLVDPEETGGLGYDPCRGTPSQVADKLSGIFKYGEEGQIYKDLLGEIVPPVVAALQAAGKPVTLTTIADALDKGELSRLGREASGRSGNPVHADLLSKLATRDKERPLSLSYLGIQPRLMALAHSAYQPLFETAAGGAATLDWDRAIAQGGLVYVTLRALTAEVSVERMGGILIQDLKQVCGRRYEAQTRGETMRPLLVVCDEAAALNDPEALRTLVNQAREAGVALCLSSQHLPQEPALRKAVLGMGVQITHRVISEDAQALAEATGMRRVLEPTVQFDTRTGEAAMGAARPKHDFRHDPNVLRDLPRGCAAVRVTGGSGPTAVRRAIVQVTPGDY